VARFRIPFMLFHAIVGCCLAKLGYSSVTWWRCTDDKQVQNHSFLQEVSALKGEL
jgi:hypothetical protein